MGKRGPAPKPTALKLVAGTRTDRVNRNEPSPSDELDVEPPEWLTDDVALATWDRLAPDLIDRGVLTGWDVQAFAEWCAAVATIATAESHLAADGHVVEATVFDRNGSPAGTRVVRNEWSRVWKDAMEVAARRAAKFGLTPSDRAGISVGGTTVADGADPERLLS